MKCKLCNSEMMLEQTDFLKCSNRKCKEHHFGIRHNDVKEVRGVAHLLKKKV